MPMATDSIEQRIKRSFWPNDPWCVRHEGTRPLGREGQASSQPPDPARPPREVTTQVNTVTAPADAEQALAMVRAGLSYLAAADPTQMAAQVQAQCLHGLEQATAIGTVARTSILGAFTAGQGYIDDGAYSPRSWLIHQTRITKGAATGHTAWVRRARAHPRMLRPWPARSCPSPGRAPCAGGPTSCPRTAGTPRTRSWPAPRQAAWTCGTWPSWPPRCSLGPGLTATMTTRTGRLRTGRSGWRPRSAARAC